MKKFTDYLKETAEFDYGHDDYYKTSTFKPIEFVNKGKADLKQKMNNPRYGDNSMEDATLEEEDQIDLENDITPIMIDRMHQLLNNADVRDDEIISGIDLTSTGIAKAAKILDIDAAQIPLLIAAVSTKLADKSDRMDEDYKNIIEAENRFGYEDDTLGNVTINDIKTGRHIYLQGTDATTLLNSLRTDPDNSQKILAHYAVLMELNEDEEDLEDNTDYPFKSEITAKNGTYNFPWKYQGRRGFATATYSGKNDSPVIKVISVRDSDGEEIMNADKAMKLSIDDQAKKMILKV